MTFRSLAHPFLKTACALAVLLLGVRPMISQTTPTESQFIASVNTAIQPWLNQAPGKPVVLSGNLVYANGEVVANMPLGVLLAYVDGLKAAGAQRVDLNPAITSINNPNVTQLYDAVVRHIRQLGLQLSINPEINTLELGKGATFQDFQNTAMQTYPKLVARYQPDNFVIVHEPTTMDARLGDVQTTVQDWDGFIRAVAPLLRQASPHTRLGAGAYQNGAAQLQDLSKQEAVYFQDFATIPDLDFLTMDIYNDDTFSTYVDWVQLAHQHDKGAYIEETWLPSYLPNPLPSTAFSPTGFLTASLDDLAVVGAASPDFETLDASWLQAIIRFASANGMEAVTPFTTQLFFMYGNSTDNKMTNSTYSRLVEGLLSSPQAQLTSTGQAYLAYSQQMGIKEAVSLSSASYATFPSIFNPSCGTATNPCNANTTVTPDELVSVFGADLATTTLSDGTFPTNLGGTTMTLVDSSNTTFHVRMFSVSPTQVNYYVPPQVAFGPAAITVTSGDGTQTTGVVLVMPVMPGIYTANESGKGSPAALAVCAGTCAGWSGRQPNGQFIENISSQSFSVASGDTVVVELFGTGLRHLSSLSAISAQINGQNAAVLYAGEAPGYTGEDQVNVQIPPGVTGQASLVLTVQDTVNNIATTSNTVTLDIQ
jgi:uncharacterized protein (TIGR03437 family)